MACGSHVHKMGVELGAEKVDSDLKFRIANVLAKRVAKEELDDFGQL